MPRDNTIQKVLVIGSGPIVIGQAAEFDYAGTQACRALQEEGIEVVLVNSNPATIMTDKTMADHVYIEPLTVNTIKKIILKERPDSILPTLGGQTGLNLAMELAESGFLEQHNVRLLGTSMTSIKKAEDREEFKKAMIAIREPIIESIIAEDVKTALEFAGEIGYPVVVRPAYTLGGTGGGIAHNPEELKRIVSDGIRLSRVHQVLVEKSVAGWKEIEYEVIRDGDGNCIAVCDMENIDPVGIHTGDSIVVVPCQTLTPDEKQMLKKAALKIINSLEIEGGCNVQFALNPQTKEYYVIEVNPRVSRSSALASKATGYPIARVSTKIAIGYSLDEIVKQINGKSGADFEPEVKYTVVKIPRWPFDKFVKADKSLGTKMKATGEVMAIGSNLEEALLKAVRSLEIGMDSLESQTLSNLSDEKLNQKLKQRTYERMFLIAEAFRRGVSIDKVEELTAINPFFLDKIRRIVLLEEELKKHSIQDISPAKLKEAKRLGFSDTAIARFLKVSSSDIAALRKEWNIKPAYKMVDTCHSVFDVQGTYYYSTYSGESNIKLSIHKKIAVLGSGPIRIGQGIEFDYCCVHCINSLKKLGYEVITINNNPETVSTDFDISDRLYFEPLTSEDVLNILELEKPEGVVVQFGGQTAIKLAKAVASAGYPIIGTGPDSIHQAEDRKEFDSLLATLKIPRPDGTTVFTEEEAVEAAERLGYPVLVRPSYVLGGQGMEIAYNEDNIREYMRIISNQTKQEHPVLIDKYLVGKEIEVDAICDGEEVLIPGIMEHIERAGVHSGDSISVYPAQSLSQKVIDKIIEYTRKLSRALEVKGMINIQYVEHLGELYVIEVNPRSSRTVPFISKVTGIPMIELATRAAMGEKLKDMGYGIGLHPSGDAVAVKVPVFSFEKLPLVEVSLGPEMKSTGEVLGIGKTLAEALYKGLTGAGYILPSQGNILITVADTDKQEAISVASKYEQLGFSIFATPGTAWALNSNYVAANVVRKISDTSPNIKDYIEKRKFDIIINTPTKGRIPQRDGFKIRRMAVENSIPCLTSLDTARAFAESIALGLSDYTTEIYSLEEIV